MQIVCEPGEVGGEGLLCVKVLKDKVVLRFLHFRLSQFRNAIQSRISLIAHRKIYSYLISTNMHLFLLNFNYTSVVLGYSNMAQ